MSDDEEFFQLIWATWAIQSENEEYGRNYITYPKKAATSDISSPFAAHKWRLETLLNELLSIEKRKPTKGRKRSVNCDSFYSIAHILNMLNALEDAEDGIYLEKHDIFQEMSRIAQRQFHWQNSFLTALNIYRSAYIYGGPTAQNFFSEQYGISIDTFSLFCIWLQSQYHKSPYIHKKAISALKNQFSENIELALDIIFISHEYAREKAKGIWGPGDRVAYRRSIFREHPCVSFGKSQEYIYAPLPDLIALRASSGLFYDIVKGGSTVKKEVGYRFEKYCRDLIASSFPELSVEGSYRYGPRKYAIDSPDIIIKNSGTVEIICECKARRMSYNAKFSRSPLENWSDGYEEIAKGIFQIWRYASHHRQGIAGEIALAPNPIGLLLTLDSWTPVAHTVQKSIISLAEKMCDSSNEKIMEKDRLPIVFCQITDLEEVSVTASTSALLESLRHAANDQYSGWHIHNVHKNLFGETIERRNYPFTERIGDVLPWWEKY